MHSDTGEALLSEELRGRAYSFLEQAALWGVFLAVGVSIKER